VCDMPAGGGTAAIGVGRGSGSCKSIAGEMLTVATAAEGEVVHGMAGKGPCKTIAGEMLTAATAAEGEGVRGMTGKGPCKTLAGEMLTAATAAEEEVGVRGMAEKGAGDNKPNKQLAGSGFGRSCCAGVLS